MTIKNFLTHLVLTISTFALELASANTLSNSNIGRYIVKNEVAVGQFGLLTQSQFMDNQLKKTLDACVGINSATCLYLRADYTISFILPGLVAQNRTLEIQALVKALADDVNLAYRYAETELKFMKLDVDRARTLHPEIEWDMSSSEFILDKLRTAKNSFVADINYFQFIQSIVDDKVRVQLKSKESMKADPELAQLLSIDQDLVDALNSGWPKLADAARVLVKASSIFSERSDSIVRIARKVALDELAEAFELSDLYSEAVRNGPSIEALCEESNATSYFVSLSISHSRLIDLKVNRALEKLLNGTSIETVLEEHSTKPPPPPPPPVTPSPTPSGVGSGTWDQGSNTYDPNYIPPVAQTNPFTGSSYDYGNNTGSLNGVTNITNTTYTAPTYPSQTINTYPTNIYVHPFEGIATGGAASSYSGPSSYGGNTYSISYVYYASEGSFSYSGFPN